MTMTDEWNDFDQQLTRLMQQTLALPDDRLEAIYDRLAEEMQAEEDQQAWTTFTTVMTKLFSQWRPAQEWTYYTRPNRRVATT